MEEVTQQTAGNADESASTSKEMRAQADQMNLLIEGLIKLVGISLRNRKSEEPERMSVGEKTFQTSLHDELQTVPGQ